MSEDQVNEVCPPQMPPAAPPQMPGLGAPMLPAATHPYEVSQDDRTMGMLVHLLALLTGFIGTLIIWLVKKDQSRFVDFHGKEALNFQLTVFLSVMVLMVVGIITFVGIFVAVPLVGIIGVGAMILEIVACIAANRGEWHRYPMTIRFIK